jgi:hypothetical protein
MQRTMKLEKSSPDPEGRDIIQYRCGLCSRIERVRLLLFGMQNLNAD